MLTNRQEQLLADIINCYISTSEPVGSKMLASTKEWQVSPATLRNEMAILEKAGFLQQPHTSAGRIPTEVGYKYYRNLFLKPGRLTKALEQDIIESYEQGDGLEQGIKILAKNIARASGEAVILALGKNYIYYTGLSNLLSQPEFSHQAEIHSLVAALDDCEMSAREFLDNASLETQILIGSENPFLSYCSLVVAPFSYLKKVGFMGILGPMRMDYDKNVSLINFCKKLLLTK